MDIKDDPLRSANIEGPADVTAAFWAKYGKSIRVVVVVCLVMFILLIIAFGVLSYLSLDPTFQNSQGGKLVETVSGPSASTRNSDFGSLINVLFWIVLVGAGMVYSKYALNRSVLFMKSVAGALGFSYAESAPMESVSGGLFSFGHEQYLAHVLSGTYQGIPVRIYTYHASMEEGKEREDFVFTVCEFTYPYHLPWIALAPKSGETLGISVEPVHVPPIKNAVYIHLEGDFNKYFSAATEKGLETEALVVLTPDVMALLLDQKERIHFESFGSRLYIYHDGFIGGKDAMSLFYENATTIATKLTSHFREVSKDVDLKHDKESH